MSNGGKSTTNAESKTAENDLNEQEETVLPPIDDKDIRLDLKNDGNFLLL